MAGPIPMNPNIANSQNQHSQQEAIMKMAQNGKPILCKCGSNVFKEGIQMVRASSMDPNNPTGKDQIIHIPVLYCVKCFLSVDVK